MKDENFIFLPFLFVAQDFRLVDYVHSTYLHLFFEMYDINIASHYFSEKMLNTTFVVVKCLFLPHKKRQSS